jgi:hypothetical protein
MQFRGWKLCQLKCSKGTKKQNTQRNTFTFKFLRSKYLFIVGINVHKHKYHLNLNYVFTTKEMRIYSKYIQL